jgi:hypothetical protein
MEEVEDVGPIVHMALMPPDPSTKSTTNQVTMFSINGTNSILLFSPILTIINLQLILLENTITLMDWYPNTTYLTVDLNNLNLQAEPYSGADQIQVGKMVKFSKLKLALPFCLPL